MADKLEACRKVLREVIVPLIENDGGELYLVEVDKKKVAVHLAGAYSGSPACSVLGERLLAPAIKRVHPKAEVIVTSGWQIPDGAERVSAG